MEKLHKVHGNYTVDTAILSCLRWSQAETQTNITKQQTRAPSLTIVHGSSHTLDLYM